MDPLLAERVRQFVGEFWRLRLDELRAETRLEEDLGMTGDDASDFLEAFADEFDVDLSGIEFHKHFGPEGIGPLFWPRELREAIRDLGRFPVTVGHLIEVAAAKRWMCPPLHGTRKWPEFPPTGLWDRELDG